MLWLAGCERLWTLLSRQARSRAHPRRSRLHCRRSQAHHPVPPARVHQVSPAANGAGASGSARRQDWIWDSSHPAVRCLRCLRCCMCKLLIKSTSTRTITSTSSTFSSTSSSATRTSTTSVAGLYGPDGCNCDVVIRSGTYGRCLPL